MPTFAISHDPLVWPRDQATAVSKHQAHQSYGYAGTCSRFQVRCRVKILEIDCKSARTPVTFCVWDVKNVVKAPRRCGQPV